MEAFSASARGAWDIWERPLSAVNINRKIQRVHCVASLVTKIKIATQIHSTRSLSVVDKATVLNSLLLQNCDMLRG
ncbi:hypothetical protein PS6_003111 [Mucor atramentarius]